MLPYNEVFKIWDIDVVDDLKSMAMAQIRNFQDVNSGKLGVNEYDAHQDLIAWSVNFEYNEQRHRGVGEMLRIATL